MEVGGYDEGCAKRLMINDDGDLRREEEGVELAFMMGKACDMGFEGLTKKV